MAALETPAFSISAVQAAQYQSFEDHDWNGDEHFQSGLAAILRPEMPVSQTAELTLRARCFYYSRERNVHINYDDYKVWKEQSEATPSNPGSEHTTAHPGSQAEAAAKLSYQEIVEMIQAGKPIPGVKDIPDTVLEGQGTSSNRLKRRKPWEKADLDSDAAAVSESAH